MPTVAVRCLPPGLRFWLCEFPFHWPCDVGDSTQLSSRRHAIQEASSLWSVAGPRDGPYRSLRPQGGCRVQPVRGAVARPRGRMDCGGVPLKNHIEFNEINKVFVNPTKLNNPGIMTGETSRSESAPLTLRTMQRRIRIVQKSCWKLQPPIIKTVQRHIHPHIRVDVLPNNHYIEKVIDGMTHGYVISEPLRRCSAAEYLSGDERRVLHVALTMPGAADTPRRRASGSGADWWQASGRATPLRPPCRARPPRRRRRAGGPEGRDVRPGQR